MNIRLREIRKSDLFLINGIRNNYSVSKTLNLFCPQSIEREIDWFNFDRNKEVHFAIVKIDEISLLIGQVSLIGYGTKERKAELTIFIDEQFWGMGYGKYACQLITHYGFTQLNLNKIFLHVYEKNTKSMRLFENLGYKIEGVLRDFIYKDGEFRDAVHFGLLRNEYNRTEWSKSITRPLLIVHD